MTSISAAQASTSTAKPSVDEPPSPPPSSAIGENKSLTARNYFGAGQERCFPKPAAGEGFKESLGKRIDPIPDGLVAGIKVDNIYRFAPPVFRDALSIGLDENNPKAKWWDEFCSEEEYNTRKEERGVPAVPIEKLEKAAMEHLTDRKNGDNLFVKMTYYQFENWLNKTDTFPAKQKARILKEVNDRKAFAGSFFVEKSGPGKPLRVILDGRPGNILLSNYSFQFTLFTLETVVDVFSSIEGKKFYCVNVDLRHFFHQISFPVRHSLAYLVKARGETSADGPASNPFVYYRCRGFPMGAVFSPYVAQAVSYSFLLAADVPVNDFEEWKKAFSAIAKKLDLDPETLAGDKFPPWLPFRRGGGLFILLDNIMIVSPIPEVAQAWSEHIKSRSRRFNVKLKNEDTTGHVIELGANLRNSIDFNGWIWFGDRRRMKDHEQDATESRLYERELDRSFKGYDSSSKTWNGTYRDLDAVLGKILWAARGARWNMRELSGLRRLYVKGAPPTSSITAFRKGAWDQLVELEPFEIEALLQVWERRCVNQPARYETIATKGEVAMCCVDAASNNLRLGGVLYPLCRLERRSDFTETYEPDLTPIAIAELQAILRGVQILQERSIEFIRLYVVGTDNLNAKYWVEDGVAKNELANGILEDIYGVLGDARIFTTYIKSNDNAADLYSREDTSHGILDTEQIRREAKSLELLRTAVKQADVESWKKRSGTRSERNRKDDNLETN